MTLRHVSEPRLPPVCCEAVGALVKSLLHEVCLVSLELLKFRLMPGARSMRACGHLVHRGGGVLR